MTTKIALFMVLAPTANGVLCVRPVSARIPDDWTRQRILHEAPRRLPETMRLYAPDGDDRLVNLFEEDQDEVQFEWLGPAPGQADLFEVAA